MCRCILRVVVVSTGGCGGPDPQSPSSSSSARMHSIRGTHHGCWLTGVGRGWRSRPRTAATPSLPLPAPAAAAEWSGSRLLIGVRRGFGQSNAANNPSIAAAATHTSRRREAVRGRLGRAPHNSIPPPGVRASENASRVVPRSSACVPQGIRERARVTLGREKGRTARALGFVRCAASAYRLRLEPLLLGLAWVSVIQGLD